MSYSIFLNTMESEECVVSEPKITDKTYAALDELPLCPVETTLMLISNKWKILIIRDLLGGTKRFGELKKSLVGISQKVLTANLRSLEEFGLVHRQVYAEVPPRVEYSLTATGQSLEPVLRAMADWGTIYQENFYKEHKKAR